MALRASHGAMRGTGPRVEVLPADELPLGVQAPALVERGGERRPNGTFAPGASTSQSRGGKARKAATTLAVRLGLGELAEGDPFRPYKAAAVTFRRVHCASVAATVGGGVCGTGPSSMIASAALALAASRYLYDTAAGDPAKLATAARLAESSRQHLLAAFELAAKEAQARRCAEPTPAERIMAELAAEARGGT